MAKVKREAQKEITKYYLTFLGEEREVTEKEYEHFKFCNARTRAYGDFKGEFVSGKIEKESPGFAPYTIAVESEEEHKFLLGLFQLCERDTKAYSSYHSHVLDERFLNLIYEMDK